MDRFETSDLLGDSFTKENSPKKEIIGHTQKDEKLSSSTDDFEHVESVPSQLDDLLGDLSHTTYSNQPDPLSFDGHQEWMKNSSAADSTVKNQFENMMGDMDFGSAVKNTASDLTKDFMEAERGFKSAVDDKKNIIDDVVNKIEDDYINPYSIPKIPEPIPVEPKKIDSDMFHTINDSPKRTPYEHDEFLDTRKTPEPEPINIIEQVEDLPPPLPAKREEKQPEKIVPKPSAPAPTPVLPTPVSKPPTVTSSTTSKPTLSAEEMFCKIGLDSWFKPEALHPKVESLIYWRDVKKSGAVFGAGLVLLLAMSCFSLISVFAYVSLLTLAGTLSFRIYKNILQAVQKTSDGHPFKDILEMDLTLSQEKVQQGVSVSVVHLNATVSELRRLFLVEDLIDSIKFGLLLWCLTHLGAWFNGMTLVIIAFVALFTLPKVYENNKQPIDTYLDLVRNKIQEITEKVKAAIPIGKKAESEKDK